MTQKDRRDYPKVAGVVKTYEDIAKKLTEIRKKKRMIEKKVTDPIRRSQELNKLDEQYFRLIKRANGIYNQKLGEDYE